MCVFNRRECLAVPGCIMAVLVVSLARGWTASFVLRILDCSTDTWFQIHLNAPLTRAHAHTYICNHYYVLSNQGECKKKQSNYTLFNKSHSGWDPNPRKTCTRLSSSSATQAAPYVSLKSNMQRPVIMVAHKILIVQHRQQTLQFWFCLVCHVPA